MKMTEKMTKKHENRINIQKTGKTGKNMIVETLKNVKKLEKLGKIDKILAALSLKNRQLLAQFEKKSCL